MFNKLLLLLKNGKKRYLNINLQIPNSKSKYRLAKLIRIFGI